MGDRVFEMLVMDWGQEAGLGVCPEEKCYHWFKGLALDSKFAGDRWWRVN